MDEIDRMAHQVERMMGDPIADSVHGFVRVVSASEPTSRFGYEECLVELVTEADGIPPTTIKTGVVTLRKWWPKVGTRLPARIAVSDPQRIDVNWNGLQHQR